MKGEAEPPLSLFLKTKQVTGADAMKTLLSAAIFGLALTSAAAAQQVQPMRYDLAPSGAASERIVRVENTQSTPLTIEVLPLLVEQATADGEVRAPADDDFLIFPPQAIIEPGAIQNIRVRYIGNPAIATSKTYRIDVRELPVDLRGGGETGVGMIVSFLTLVSVVPDGAEPDLQASVSSSGTNGALRVEFSNNGARYARLSEYLWRFSGDGADLELDGDQLSALAPDLLNLVLPGATVTVDLPAIEGMPSNPRLDMIWEG